ncbi:hypothetical protein FBEOM_3417 [Fusarium beomiforme]|uniref:Uncharacterized protein n=1 Tax=Fusarium beomiforme TaxID=44412 RepID=A0A9P5E1G4_9HYPO|nr:hypothetical protein FBEOM_3417 [Fusarium beomiforme]
MASSGNLLVYYGKKDEWDELSPDSYRFKIVQAIVQLALSILETTKSKASLVRIGKETITEGNTLSFLTYTSARLTICLSGSTEIGGEAEAERQAWKGGMRNYDAGVSGNIVLNKMGISVAHEVVHLFIGFLTGNPRSNTPPLVTLEPYGNRQRGEAGRYWEELVLGGVAECWSNNNDIMGVRQSGTPYLFQNGFARSNGWKVSMSYIERFVDGSE